jgi:hypothetical protein
MRDHSIVAVPDWYRRPGAVRRTPMGSPCLPSQDVCRYQAKNMPPPTYDLDRKDAPVSLLTILVLTLAATAAGAAIVFIDRIGRWLSP